MSRSGPRRAAGLLALSLSITVVGLGGMAGHSSALPLAATAAPVTEPAPPETVPPETVPPETAPPEAVPGTVPAVAEAEEDDGIDVGTWLLITVFIVLAFIIVSAVVTGIGRRSKKTGAAAAPVPTAPVNDAPHQLLASAEWMHDQLSLELMAAAPTQALQRWAVERTRIDNIVIGTQAEASRLNSASWLQLGQFLSELAAAIETNVQLRMQEPPNVGLVQESANVITARRNDIQAAINLLRPTLR